MSGFLNILLAQDPSAGGGGGPVEPAFVMSFGASGFGEANALGTQYTSDNDITTWTGQNPQFGGSPIINGAFFTPTGLVYAESISTWVLVWQANSLWYSTDDGATWGLSISSIVPATSAKDNCVAWSPTLGLFAVGGNSGQIATSPDGITWTNQNPGVFGSSQVVSIHWAADLGLFVAGGTNNQVAYSSDGSSWTLTTAIPGSFDVIIDVYSVGTRVFASNNDTEFAYWTDDDLTAAPSWTQSINANKPVSGAGSFAANSDGSVLLWAGPGVNDGEYVWRSTDNGVNFTRINVASQIGAGDLRTYSVIYDPDYGFVVSGERSVGSPLGAVIITSPDGLTWTLRLDEKFSHPDGTDINPLRVVASKNQV